MKKYLYQSWGTWDAHYVLTCKCVTMSFPLDFREKSANSESTSSCFRCSTWEETVNPHESCKYDSEYTWQQQCFSAAVQGQSNSPTGTEGLQETWAAGSTAERWCQSKRQELPRSNSTTGETCGESSFLVLSCREAHLRRLRVVAIWGREISGSSSSMVYEL